MGGERELEISIDLEAEGLNVVLKDYQIETLKLLWETQAKVAKQPMMKWVGLSSREVWAKVNERMRILGMGAISRASIINFLNTAAGIGVLNYTEITGKGGHRRIYTAALTEQEYWVWLMKTVDSKLKEAAGLQHW